MRLSMIKIGIIGAGNIAGTMAGTIRTKEMEEKHFMEEGHSMVECYAVASRDYDRAKAFAEKYGFKKAYGSYEEMLQDPDLTLVYVATPHSHHYDHIKLCLEYGKHVLCEKSFTINAAQAEEVFRLAGEKGLLLTEAIWTRYLPMRKTLDEVLASGIIGHPYMLTANLGYIMGDKERISRPELAGGALLDVGIYPLNFAAMVFGSDISQITGQAVMMESGVDAQNSITLTYPDGRMAVLNSSAVVLSDRRGIIYGDKGFVEVTNINNYEGITVYNTARELIAHYDTPWQITGYEYEVEACVRAIELGETECPQMPHEETLCLMRWMDELRRQWGMKYPAE